MKKKLTRIMGDFIGEMDWNLFITLSYKNGCRENFNRRIMESYYQKNRNLIDRMFFVSERNKNYVDKLKSENPEKLKEWRRTYYLKRKEKLKEQESNI
jgi:hypothetical protein